MFKIFADAHKKIASEIHRNISNVYDIDLDKDSLIWGSILPDILPKYKFIRHYKDESLDFVVREIIAMISDYRNLDLLEDPDPLRVKHFSRRLGIISHYLSDYVCLAHAKRWTFQDNFLKHIKYESKLNEIALEHEFQKNKIIREDLDVLNLERENIEEALKEYINYVVEEEYFENISFQNDLDFALSLSFKISIFIIETIDIYSESYLRNILLEI